MTLTYMGLPLVRDGENLEVLAPEDVGTTVMSIPGAWNVPEKRVVILRRERGRNWLENREEEFFYAPGRIVRLAVPMSEEIMTCRIRRRFREKMYLDELR